MSDTLPHDTTAERAVLKAAMESPMARKAAGKILTGVDFHHPVHERVWDALNALSREGKPVDAATVASAVLGQRGAQEAMLEVATAPGIPAQVDYYADIVRSHATRRRVIAEAERARQWAMDPSTETSTLAASTAARFAAIRDSGAGEDITARTLGELLAEEDEPFDWLIPDYLERGDRFMLTGVEGLGKSTLLRQLAVFGAAGLHPLKNQHITPLTAVVLDMENTERHVKRKLRPLRIVAAKHGTRDPESHVLIECPGRMDVTRDRDLARIHHLLDAAQPDLVVLGPLYRMVPRAIQTDDEAAPLLTALDTIRDRGVALLIEAHAGHGIGKHGDREMRPRGSSALLGWPEFGYGLRAVEGTNRVEMVPWRGDRDERSWPRQLTQGGTWPWFPASGVEGVA